MLNFKWNTKKQVNPDISKVIIIDADEDYRTLIGNKLKKLFDNCQIDFHDPMTQGKPAPNFPWDKYDLLILDYFLEQDSNGLDWYSALPRDVRPVTIMLTGRGDEQVAVRAIKSGIDSYLVKERFNLTELENTIRDAFLWKDLNNSNNTYQQSYSFSSDRESELTMVKGRFYSAIESLYKNNIENQHLVVVSPNIIKIKDKKPENLDEYLGHVYQKIQDYFIKQGIICQSSPFKDIYVIMLLTTSNLSETLLKFCKYMENTEIDSGDNDKFSCDLSIGAVSINSSSEDIYGCISLAVNLSEQAHAKKDNKISIYKQLGSSKDKGPDDEKAAGTDYISFDIARAVKEGRILANYQPWVYISNDESIGVKDIYDVRIELIDTDGRIIERDERVNLLQNIFATRVIDRWMTRECISQLDQFAKNDYGDSNIKLVVKLTSDSVADPKFLTWCETLLLNSKCPKEGLLFEIDAADCLEHKKSANKLINTLRDKFGIKFVLSGIQNHDLYYRTVKNTFFDYVKLNIPQLLRNSDENFNKLVSDIKNNGSMSIAVNMETADTLSHATEYSIDYIQGYLVEKPKKDVMTSVYSDISFEI